MQGTGVTANALHPGVVSTAFGAEDPGRTQRLLVPLLRPFMKTPPGAPPPRSAWPPLPSSRGVTGRYFANRVPKRSSPRSHDEDVAARLWRVSAELVGIARGNA